MTTSSLYPSSNPHGDDAEAPHDQLSNLQAEDEGALTIPSGVADSAEERHEAPPIGERLVSPATAKNNQTGEPVRLRDALAAWSDGSMASHSQFVREKTRHYANVLSTCTDHDPDRKTCPNCKKARGELDAAKRRGNGHCYAGQFSFRHQYGLVALSQVVPLDYDGVNDPQEVRDSIAELPYCIGSRVSVSGRGVHALVHVASLPEWDGLQPPGAFVNASRAKDRAAREAAYLAAAEAHPQWVVRTAELREAYVLGWHRAVERVRMDLGLSATVDEKARDIARLLYDSHDNDAKINLDAITIPEFREVDAAPPSADLVGAALHALNSIHPPSDTNRWMALVYHCKAVGVLERDVDQWSSRGDRYEERELSRGAFLCYQTLQPKETADKAVTRLESEAKRQDPTFIPMKRLQEKAIGRNGAEEEQDPAIETNTASWERIPVFAGQELSAEARRVVDAIVLGNDPPKAFTDITTTSILEIIGTEVRPVPKEGIAILMSDFCQFLVMRKDGPKPTYQPQMLTGAVSVELPRRLPVLNGMKRSPFFFNGQLVTLADGFHSPSGYYCRMIEEIDAELDVEECLRRLQDLLGEFPYVQNADWANTIGLLVGQVLKVENVGPMAFFDKPSSQTGASLLARTIATLVDGKEPEIMTVSQRTEETDKRLIACLNSRPSSIVIDNISVRMASDIIASGMTAEETGGRLLGGNNFVRVPTKSVQFYLNGNNSSMERDLINRSINVRLDSGLENPEERTHFRHVLPRAALEHRTFYLSAAVSLVQRWIDAGCPTGTGPVLDSYGDWMRCVAGILEVAGVSGFNRNRPDFKRRADTEGADAAIFVEAWLGSGALNGRSPSALLPLAEEVFSLNGDCEENRARSLGHRLRKLADKIFVIQGCPYSIRRDRGSRSSYSLEALE